MAAPLKAGMAPGLDLGEQYVVEFTALDASTGAVVNGVTVSGGTLTVENVGGGNLAELLKPVEPLWVPLPADQLD